MSGKKLNIRRCHLIGIPFRCSILLRAQYLIKARCGSPISFVCKIIEAKCHRLTPAESPEPALYYIESLLLREMSELRPSTWKPEFGRKKQNNGVARIFPPWRMRSRYIGPELLNFQQLSLVALLVHIFVTTKKSNLLSSSKKHITFLESPSCAWRARSIRTTGIRHCQRHFTIADSLANSGPL